MSSETSPMTNEASQHDITYFSLVRIRHREKGLLASLPANYTHLGGSGQQAVGCVHDNSDLTWWMIRPFNGGDFDKSAKDLIKAGDIVRFQHVQTGRNLHSHTLKSPCSDQQEVSAFGESGNGNHDDDWIVETRSEEEINTSTPLLFRHVVTNCYLHSHDDRHFTIDNIELQEVTAYDDDDANNNWQIVEVKSPDALPSMHPFIELDLRNTQINFNTAKDLQDWLLSEKNAYSWLLGQPPNALGSSTVRDYVENQFFHLENTLAKLLLPLGPSSTEDLRNTISKKLSSTYTQFHLLDTGSSRFKWLNEIAKSDPASASYSLAYFLNQEPELDNIQALKGIFNAFALENGFSERAKFEAESLAELRQNFGRDSVQLKIQHEQVQTGIESLFAETQRLLANKKYAFDDLFQTNRKQLEGIINAAELHASTNDAVTYWEKKARRHLVATSIFGLASLVSALCAVSGFYYLATTSAFLSQGNTPIPDWHRVSVTLIGGTFVIWLVRVLVQLLYSNFHLMSDARERAVMVQVYISLLRDNHLPLGDDQKLLVLQSLFRPAPSGIVKEDGSPSTLLNLLASKLIK